MALDKQQGYVCFANVHMVIEATNNKMFSLMVNNASLVLTDGMPLVKSIKLLYGDRQDRIAGMDIFPDLLRQASDKGLTVFFFGTTESILSEIEQRVKAEFPNLRIAGLFSPPFGKPINDVKYIEQISRSGADLVFVALGCPKQENWMAENSSRINAVLLGIGGAFPVFAGITKRAPLWMQRSSLEWLYRLIQEPRRMWKRYFVTNTLFVFLLFKELFLRRFGIKRTNS
jgi:N-acetylglucosaminyldiphosphoundecaprenol N-acetyl-beta-D-mannosaminyltransferase